MRKKFIAGNWKMNKNKDDAISYIKEFNDLLDDSDADIVLAVPFTLLQSAKDNLSKKVKLAAQNMFYEEKGAFTGEISPGMIKDFAEYVIIGHSERRKYFNETDEIVNKKIKTALKSKLKVIFCLGETLEERKTGNTQLVIETQLKNGLMGISSLKEVVIAYEPVWAIGTGNTATPQQAEEVHVFLRSLIEQLYGKKTAESTRLIYGGSVNPENAASILKMNNIDGCLPGGASLDPKKFYNIIKA